MQAFKIDGRDTVAKFDSKCCNCKEAIQVGQPISLQHVEYNGINPIQGVGIRNFYVHSDCIIDDSDA